MTVQFDMHRNKDTLWEFITFVVIVQPALFSRVRSRMLVPLVCCSTLLCNMATA
jgi:hypothetical protein